MIDNSVIKRLAIQCRFTPSLIFDAENRFNLFAQAVIENYKASLVPVAWMNSECHVQSDVANRNYKKIKCHIGHQGYDTPLYALKETK